MDVFPLEIENSWRSYYILCLDEEMGEDEFVQNAGVMSDSYAGALVTNLYERIMKNSLDLKGDFERFFRAEYETFEKFLKQRYFMFDDEIGPIIQHYDASIKIILFRPYHSFIAEDYGIAFLRRLFEKRRDI